MEEYEEKYDLSFTARDSEWMKYEFTIPEGMEAEIKDGKVILKRKESEDERIRKEIIRIVDVWTHSSPVVNGIPRETLLAWLEKQGETFTKKDVDDAYLKGISDAKQELEKQGKQKPILDFKASNWYVSKVDGKIHDMTYNPTDKAEPKFKVGDWIVQENIGVYKIIEVCESWYEVVDNKDKHYSIGFDKEYMCHLWTIQDAKDGDVLCSESGWTCIFKALDNHTNTFSSYCFMDSYKWFCNTGSECHTLDKAFIKAYNGEIYPATKEQRDQLEKAMADARYTFDFEKKELKEIGRKPWSEKDEEMIKYFNEVLDYAFKNWSKFGGKATSALEWLELLKDRYTWKPSKEQIKGIECAIKTLHHQLNIGDNRLDSLYDDLKKLREE